MLDDAATLKQRVLLAVSANDHLVDAVFLDALQVGQQFGEHARAVEHIDASIVIKEERRVVKVGQTAVERPSPTGILRSEYIAVRVVWIVGAEESVERAIMILQRRGPLAASVVGTTLQVVERRVGKTVEQITGERPVYQVF